MSHKWNTTELCWALRESQDETLTLHEFALLSAFIFASDSSYKFELSIQRMADITRMSSRTVSRNITKIIQKQYIRILERGCSMSHKSSKYELMVGKIISNASQKIYKYVTKTSRGAIDRESCTYSHTDVNLLSDSHEAIDRESNHAHTEQRHERPLEAAPRGALATTEDPPPPIIDFSKFTVEDMIKYNGWE